MLLPHALRAAGDRPTVSSLSFNAGTVNTTDGATITLSNLSIGTANANRYIVLAFRYRQGSGSLEDPTVTVAGVSCSLVAREFTGTAIISAIYITDSPIATGTTANVVMTAGTSRTLTSLFAASYSLITFGSPPKLIFSDYRNSANPCVIPSPFTSGQFGIVNGGASTGSGLSSLSMSASGVATQNYYSGVVEFGALISGTLIGSGDITFTTVGTSSSARAVLAIWR